MPSEPSRDKLEHVNKIEDVVELLKSAENIVVITGAGISVPCGIPDFRSENGLYSVRGFVQCVLSSFDHLCCYCTYNLCSAWANTICQTRSACSTRPSSLATRSPSSILPSTIFVLVVLQVLLLMMCMLFLQFQGDLSRSGWIALHTLFHTHFHCGARETGEAAPKLHTGPANVSTILMLMLMIMLIIVLVVVLVQNIDSLEFKAGLSKDKVRIHIQIKIKTY